MKFIILFFLGCSLLACSRVQTKNPTAEKQDSVSYRLKADERVYYSLEDTSFTLQLLKIEDSRCPRNARCIWQGEVKVSLAVAGQKPQTLCLGNCQVKDSAANKLQIDLQNDNFILILEDVQPYPALSSKNEEPQQAVLTIKRVTL
jgi:hypothetical protein